MAAFRTVSAGTSSVGMVVYMEVSAGSLSVGVVVFRKVSAEKLSPGRCLQGGNLLKWSSSGL